MNGFADHSSLHEGGFDEPKGLSVKTFDAFPKTKPTYLTRSRSGNAWTLTLLLSSLLLILTETRRWFAGTTYHSFSVEKGVSHQLQINVDMVVRMPCHDLNVNVQDASGDRILAGEMLRKDATSWAQWDAAGAGAGGKKRSKKAGSETAVYGKGDQEDVHEYLGRAGRKKGKFMATPKLRGREDACRIWGSMELNKVQGDFHVTARGHGYIEFEEHLSHDTFNFTHQINELSFGPFYPSLVNPLDNTLSTTEHHFHKFQYYCSVVPTIYTTEPHHLKLAAGARRHDAEPLTNANPLRVSASTVWTNQYAVTEQSRPVSDEYVPGIFVKFDIEPILIVMTEERGGLLALAIRLINLVSGVLVAGSWAHRLTDWGLENWTRSGRERMGFLGRRDGKLV